MAKGPGQNHSGSAEPVASLHTANDPSTGFKLNGMPDQPPRAVHQNIRLIVSTTTQV